MVGSEVASTLLMLPGVRLCRITHLFVPRQSPGKDIQSPGFMHGGE